jgi:nitrogen fixation protein FixH
MTATTKKKPFKFPIWGWFYVFFGVIFISNGFMVYWATHSFTGLVVEEPYEKGLAYNGTLAEKEIQAKLGWGSTFKLAPISEDGFKQNIVFRLGTKNTAAVTGADVSLTLFRPTKDGMDVTFELTEAPETGMYEAVITLPAKGQWDFRFTATRGEEVYKANEVKVIY